MALTGYSTIRESVREDALVRYVGALHAQINLGRNRRLARSLNTRSSHEQRRELAERLPDAVYLALREGHAGDSPGAILRRAVLLLEHDANPRRRYRPRSRGPGSDGYDPHSQPWPIPSHRYDPSQTVVALLADGMSPQVVDEALRSLGMGTYDETSARIAHWMPELMRDLDDVVSRRPWERFGELEEFVNREEAEAELREPFIEEEMVILVEERRRTARLTPREAEILMLQGSGLKRPEIMRHLRIQRTPGLTSGCLAPHLGSTAPPAPATTDHAAPSRPLAGGAHPAQHNALASRPKDDEGVEEVNHRDQLTKIDA